MFSCKYNVKTRNIGSGSYGIVSIVEKDGDKYAFKKIKKDEVLKASYFYNPIELDILFRLNSPYLVKGEEITVPKECEPNSVGLVSEYIDGNLGKDIKNFNMKERKRMMYDIALGLKCMHDNSYLHLDIKLENTMYRKEIKPRGVLLDYGLSSYAPYGVEYGINTTQGRFSFDFNSPKINPDKYEIFNYNEKDDIWALCITFLEMLAIGTDGKGFAYVTEDIYTNYSKNKEKGNIVKSYRELAKYQTYLFASNRIDETLEDYVFRYAPKDIENKEMLKDLLKNMLKVNDKLRYNIQQVVEHPYFTSEKTRFMEKHCFVKDSKLVKIEPHINVDYHKGVKDIISYCRKEFRDKSSYILFMAVDIYMRFLYNIHKYHELEDKILAMIPELPKMCCLIANKYFYWGEYELDNSIDEIEKFIKEENLIYKVIDGRIREERYFSNCKNFKQIQFVYDFFFKNDKNLENFLNYNGKELIESNVAGSNEKEKDTFTFSIKKLNL